MTRSGTTPRPDPEPPLSITAESVAMAADLMLLVAAGSDPHDQKRSILRYPDDIEPTLDALATITGQLPQILDQLSVFLADRERRAEFAVDRRSMPATAQMSNPRPWQPVDCLPTPSRLRAARRCSR